ncbi:MAG: hypothetical protein JWL59_152 [Chthoniobacteraceae bacterium]|nr:hypothetical protein [Chthoniobacteraceae bacterium]
MNWYYDAGGGERQGPITEAALDSLLSAGSITDDTLVWRQGMTEWAPLRSARMPSVGSPETERCDACGLFVPVTELIKIGPSNVCASCKPAILQQLQQGNDLPSLDRGGPAWEQKESLGTWSAAVATVKAVLVSPGEAFSTMKREGGLGKPLLFHMLLGTVGGLVSLVYNAALRMAMPMPEPANPFPGINIPVLTGWMMFAYALFIPFIIVVVAFLYSGVFHLALMICGGARQPFETTFRVVTYAFGSAAAIQLVPGCGVYISGIWGLVCLCIGFARAHEIGTGRAVTAVLLPSAICCIGVAGLVFAAIGAVSATQGVH